MSLLFSHFVFLFSPFFLTLLSTTRILIRRLTRGAFLKLGHFDKQSCTSRERKAPQGKMSGFSPGNS